MTRRGWGGLTASSMRWRFAVALVAVAAIGCAPRLAPLTGVAAPAQLPSPGVPVGHWQIRFEWTLDDPEMSGRGDGVARVASPDSVRLDFFLAGGNAGGAAVLIGDSLRLPRSAGTDFAGRLVPPPPMLWAALGRLALPPLLDTLARRDGELLRADLGRPTEWRVTFRGDSLVRVERVRGGRSVEWVDRTAADGVRYRNETSRRSLVLRITRVFEVPDFDASIWRFTG
jgi:hypothetical protein